MLLAGVALLRGALVEAEEPPWALSCACVCYTPLEGPRGSMAERGDEMAAKKWYAYTVSHLHMDMLRYEGSYVEEVPPIDERYSFPEDGIISYQRVVANVVSARPPVEARWRSVGSEVTAVRRVERPTVPMWTVRKPPIFNADLEWVQEIPR